MKRVKIQEKLFLFDDFSNKKFSIVGKESRKSSYKIKTIQIQDLNQIDLKKYKSLLNREFIDIDTDRLKIDIKKVDERLWFNNRKKNSYYKTQIDSNINKYQVLSKLNCIYSLPNNLNELMNTTPLEYLIKYSNISVVQMNRLKDLYNKYTSFRFNYLSKVQNDVIQYENIVQAINDYNEIKGLSHKLKEIYDFLGLKQEQSLSLTEFQAIVLFAQRYVAKTNYRDHIEKCDFEFIERKLLKISEKMNQSLYRLLKWISKQNEDDFERVTKLKHRVPYDNEYRCERTYQRII